MAFEANAERLVPAEELPPRVTNETGQADHGRDGDAEQATRRGRPRSSRADRAIAAATIELLATGGLSALKIEHVAERAGVSKGTIYRRWATKEDLVAAALSALADDLPTPDTGELEADLVNALCYQLGLLSAGLGRLAALALSEAAFSPVLAEALRKPTKRRHDLLEGILARAVARGDLRNDLDLDLAVNLLWGPVYYHFLTAVTHGSSIQADYAERVVAAVLPQLR